MGVLNELNELAINAEIDFGVSKNSLEAAINALGKSKKGINVFPVDVFPKRTRQFITENCWCYGSAHEHYGLSIITAIGTILGNRLWAVERKTVHPPLFYSVLVDMPGRGKSPIIKEVLKPIFKIEKKYRDEHRDALRAAAAAAAANADSKPAIPASKEIILQDFTIESVHRAMQSNPLGLIVYRDEVTGWLHGMNAYKAGSDEQFWLENFNGGIVKINRVKNERPLWIPHSFVSVIGTTQPIMLEEFGNDKKSQNGFLARLLFSYPEDTLKPMYNNRFVDDAITENWANIVQTLYQLPQDINAPEDQYGDWEIRPVRMPLDSQAQTLYARYFDSISNETNRAEDEISAAVITKYDSHVMRLALVLRMLWWAEEEATDWEIGLEELQSIKINATAMQGAIKLAGYFKHTSLKVVNRLGSPVDQLEDKYRLLYSKMPDEITREQAIDLAKVAGISERSLARFMNRQNLFRRVGQGRYAKLLEY